MNMAELVARVATDVGIEKTQARKTVEAVLAAVTDAAKAGEPVALSGFGQFKVKDKPAREGRNPATIRLLRPRPPSIPPSLRRIRAVLWS